MGGIPKFFIYIILTFFYVLASGRLLRCSAHTLTLEKCHNLKSETGASRNSPIPMPDVL